MDKYKISVRRLAEFILKSGDIEQTAGALKDAEAMQEGQKIHKKLQKMAGPEYRAEVTLKTEYDVGDDMMIVLEGRADGIIEEYRLGGLEDGGEASLKLYHTVDEIKGTYTDVNRIEAPLPEHMGQALCYAYIYALQNDLEGMDVQVTYVNIETEKVKRFTETKTFEQLKQWFGELMGEYAKWLKWQRRWRIRRNKSAEKLAFPFEYRPSQRMMVSGVYRTILQKKKLFMEAPTGTGKTISTIYPAVKIMGEGLSDKIFYLTAKTITRTVAEETYALLRGCGLEFKSVTLTAKEKICIFDETKCNPQDCPRAKGHFDRVNEAVFELITKESAITKTVIDAYAEAYQVCPFEFQLDIALWIDGVICDYNYVFDPQAYLKRFFDNVLEEYIFLIDEAHNLVERAREMYSAPLYLSDFEKAKTAVLPYERRLAGKIGKCIKCMRELYDECEDCRQLESVGGLSVFLMRMISHIEKFLKSHTPAPVKIKEKILELYLNARWFVNVYENMDSRYIIYNERQADKEFMIKLFCVDPSGDLGECLAKGRSAVFFSATLLPIQYYKALLSITPKEDYDLYAESPFDTDKRLIVTAGDVSSKFTRRSRREYEKIADYILKIIRSKNGNYMVFFPSYAFMQSVYEIIAERELSKAGNGIKIILQESAMTEQAREDFLKSFKTDVMSTVIGFCVLGGIFSEGIDLKEDRLIGAVIVGTGLPQTGGERELLKNYFDKKSGNGFDFAYLYTGMNKVLQAAGRVIRTENDRGIIALLDERFNYSQYRNLFPREWFPNERVDIYSIEEKINKFWENEGLS